MGKSANIVGLRHRSATEINSFSPKMHFGFCSDFFWGVLYITKRTLDILWATGISSALSSNAPLC